MIGKSSLLQGIGSDIETMAIGLNAGGKIMAYNRLCYNDICIPVVPIISTLRGEYP
jgi:hypothetical protein